MSPEAPALGWKRSRVMAEGNHVVINKNYELVKAMTFKVGLERYPQGKPRAYARRSKLCKSTRQLTRSVEVFLCEKLAFL
jgi:hypothetical protein